MKGGVKKLLAIMLVASVLFQSGFTAYAAETVAGAEAEATETVDDSSDEQEVDTPAPSSEEEQQADLTNNEQGSEETTVENPQEKSADETDLEGDIEEEPKADADEEAEEEPIVESVPKAPASEEATEPVKGTDDNAVAEINGVKYETLEAAFTAAADGDTITLLKDCSGNGIKVPQGKYTTGLTVDFGGFTYTVDGATVGSAGTETQAFQLLMDNKITFTDGTIYSEKALFLVQNYSDLTLESMTLTLNNSNYASAYTLSNNNGTVTIEDTTINANAAGGFAFDVCRYSSYPSVNVTVTGNSAINGDIEVSASGNDAKDGFSLMLQSGTFNGDIVLDSSAKVAMASTPEKATIQKSTSVSIDAPDGYEWENSETTSTLVLKEYVAQIGEVKYYSLEEAFAAANDGDTIVLLKDSSGNGIVVPEGKFNNKGLRVDFGRSNTYTVDGTLVGSTGTETQAFQLLKNNKITFTNGAITSSNAKMLIQNYSDLTLELMTLTLDNPNYTSAYTLSNNNGTVTIKDTTINANTAGGFAFDVCRYSSYPSVNVTVTGNSVINGDIEVSASSSDAKDGFSLMLESGTFSGKIVLDASAKAAMASTPEKAKVQKSLGDLKVGIPDDYKWEEGESKDTLVPKHIVAQIGEVKYESLAEAVSAVPTDGTETTITMIDNEAIDVVGSAITVKVNQNILLDLNGYQVIGTASDGATSALITNKGTLTIKDSVGSGKLISGATSTWIYDGSDNYSGSYASNTITNSGTLTVDSGYIENISTGSATYAIDNNSSGAHAIANIEGGTIKAHSVAIRQFANSTTNDNTVNISGGMIEAGYSGIWIQLPGSDASKAMKASLNVTGGTITGDSYAFYDYTYGNSFDASQYNLSSGTFNGDIFSFGANITISGGTYNGEVAIKQTKASDVSVTGGYFSGDVYTYDANASEAFIKGGYFATLTYEYEGKIYDCDWMTLLDSDYKYIDNPDEENKDVYPYKVVPKDYVAQIGSVKYETLEAAFAAAADGDTITLLKSSSGNGIKVPEGKFGTNGLTVDFGGFTYTIDGTLVGSTGTETQAFQLLKDNKITFKDGVITSSNAKMLIQNYSNLTLDGMELSLTNAGYASAYTLSNNNGSVEIKDTKIHKNTGGGFAFDVCRYSSYPSVNVTVKGSSEIDGDIEVSASGNDAKDGFSLMLESGTFNGDIVLDPSAKAAMASTPDKAKVQKTTNGVTVGIPADYKWKEDEGAATSTLVPKDYVAQIGGEKYETLEAAFAAAVDGDTITLLKSSSGNGIKVPEGKYTTGLTVDFGGFTYTVDGTLVGSTWTETQAFQLLKDNKITFKGGTIYSEKALFLVQNYSDLTLDGMELSLANAGYAYAYTLSNNNGNVEIKDTKIHKNTGGGFAFDVCRYASYPSVNVTVKGDSVIDGDIEVSASGNDAKDGFSLMLESGTFNGDIVLDPSAKAAMASTPDKAKVQKTTEGVAVGIPADYKWKEDEGAATSTLVPKDYVAQIGSVKYETLEAAFAAAVDGDTITLLKDSSGNGIIAPQGKFETNGLTVDFGGFTYTVDGTLVGSTGTETQAFQLLKDNKITFKDGAITSSNAKMLIQNYSNLTLDGMELSLTNAGYAFAYTLSNNNGSIEIKDTKIHKNTGGGFAFDVCRYSSYPSVNVTVKGNSEIDGDIEVYASGSDAKDGFSLMLESGIFSGKIVLDATAAAAMESTPEKAKIIKENTVAIVIPEGYKWVKYDETHMILSSIYVAKNIDTGKKYTTLNGALAVAESGQTVVPLTDIKDEAYILVGSGVTLDLNGYDVTDATLLYVTGTLVDSGETRGKFSSMAYYLGQSENSEFPIYDSATGTYSLYNLGVDTWDPTTWARYAYALKRMGDIYDASNLIYNAADDGRVAAVVRMKWAADSSSSVVKDIAFNSGYLNAYMKDAWNLSIRVSFTGLDSIQSTITATPMFVVYDSNNAIMMTLPGSTWTVKE